VRVTDAVGVIAIPGLQITVKPKIPMGHLLHMFGQVDVLPRLDKEGTEIEQSEHLFVLVAGWFLTAAEQLLRLGLIRDYELERQELPSVRGRLEPLNTALLYYSGRLAFDCEYEDFTYNTPLNRVIRAAAQKLAASPLLTKEVRARAAQVAARIEEAQDLRPGDTEVKADRRTAHYRDPVLLAKTIIRSLGRTPLTGGHIGWTFLIRTPEAVEDALRLFVTKAMAESSVHKTGLRLSGTALTFNPDLVFGAPSAIGDVKYKLSGGEWIRSDLYQLVAFATGFRVHHALLVRFREPIVVACRDLMVGGVHVSERTWPADPLIPAGTAAAQFVDGVRHWIASCAVAGAHGDVQLLTA
jgi:5-methylcytosine-specific restriction enzyme subunit McrC